MENKKIKKVWTFESGSSPDKKYETLKYNDGSTSCNCPGWTRRAERTCKHTRMIDQEIADSECITFHDYQETKSAPVKTAPVKSQIKSSVEKDKPIVRKIQW